MTKRERELRERWPKWEYAMVANPITGRFRACAWGKEGGRFRYMRAQVPGGLCTRRSDAWRSLARAMERTRRALEVNRKEE